MKNTNGKAKKQFKMPHLLWIMMGILLLCSIATYIIPAGQFAVAEDGSLIGNEFQFLGHQTPVNPLQAILQIMPGLQESAAVIFVVMVSGAAIEVFLSTKCFDRFLDYSLYKMQGKEYFTDFRYVFPYGISGCVWRIGCINRNYPDRYSICKQTEAGSDCRTGRFTICDPDRVWYRPNQTVCYTRIDGNEDLWRFCYQICNHQSLTDNWPDHAFGVCKTNPEKSREVDYVCVRMAAWFRGRNSWGIKSGRIIMERCSKSYIIFRAVCCNYDLWSGRRFQPVICGYGQPDAGGSDCAGAFVRYVSRRDRQYVCKRPRKYGVRRLCYWTGQNNIARFDRRKCTAYNIVYVVTLPLLALPRWISSVGMTLVIALINPIIPSATSKAAILVPIIKPIGEVLQLNPEMVVQAFQFGDGFTNIVSPLLGWTIGGIAMAKVSYPQWLKWALPKVITLVAVSCLIVLLLTMIGLTFII